MSPLSRKGESRFACFPSLPSFSRPPASSPYNTPPQLFEILLPLNNPNRPVLRGLLRFFRSVLRFCFPATPSFPDFPHSPFPQTSETPLQFRSLVLRGLVCVLSPFLLFSPPLVNLFPPTTSSPPYSAGCFLHSLLPRFSTPYIILRTLLPSILRGLLRFFRSVLRFCFPVTSLFPRFSTLPLYSAPS